MGSWTQGGWTHVWSWLWPFVYLGMALIWWGLSRSRWIGPFQRNLFLAVALVSLAIAVVGFVLLVVRHT